MSAAGLKEALPILLVEDDEEDVEIAQRAFHKARITNPVHVVRDGQEAVEFLKRTGRHAEAKDAPRPAIVLLDLKLPRLDGHTVLRLLKSDPDLRRIPVVVLTTSNNPADVLGCYDEGANTYVTKPVEFDQFLEAVAAIGRYWLCVAEIPTA